MPSPVFNIGNAANDGTGDPIRTAFQKANRLPNPDSTINAGSGDYVGTTEAKITLAIAAAVAAGAKYVFVPQSMLPYNASLVTFNSAVRMTMEGRDPSVMWVEAYGAAGDGVTDDTTAIQAAENVRPAGTTLRFTFGKTYLCSASTGATVLRTKASGQWDLTGATIKYGGAGNLTTGADGGELGLINVLNAPFQIGGMGAILDGNSKCPTPLTFLHTLSGISLLPQLTIQNALEGQTTSVWSGLGYRLSTDVSGVAIGALRALNVYGFLNRPNCPFANASDVILTHGDMSCLVVGGNVAEVIGTNAVRSCSGYALVNGNTAATGNFNVQFERMGHNGIITGQVSAGGGVGQLVWMDFNVHDIGASTFEMYGQFLPVASALTWGTTITPDASGSICKTITITSDIAATIATPLNPPGAALRDMYMRFIVRNNLGTPLTTPIKFQSGATAYDAQGPLAPLPGLYVVVDFVYDQPNNVWVECNRSRVPGVFVCDGAAYNSPAGSPVAVKTFVIPGSTMVPGQGVRIKVWGRAANNANGKSVQLLIGATQLVTATQVPNTASVWEINMMIMVRVSGSGSQTYSGFADSGPAGLGPNHYNAGGLVTFDNTVDQTIKVQATQVAAADIILDGQLVEFVGQ